MRTKWRDPICDRAAARSRREKESADVFIVTTRTDLREIIRDALADALRGQETPSPELVSAEELGKRVRVHARTVRNWVLHGCPHVRAGRKLRFRESDVIHWLEERGS